MAELGAESGAEPLDLRIDVSGALPIDITGGEPLEIAVWVFLPDAVPDQPTVICLLNGGTYDRRYFHFEVPGRAGYSCAEYLRARGHVVVVPDHLGVGASGRAKNQMLATRQVCAAANHAAMEEVYARLASGSLVPEFPALATFVKVGGGHSMGGFQTITQQAAHCTYDLCLILGYTAYGVQLTVDGKLVSADPGELDTSQPDYALRDRTFLRSTFHWDDVPDDVIAVDDGLLAAVPYVISTQSITQGIVREDAASIKVPIYINLGERDVSPDPHAEPGFYRASRDITLNILPRSGHCQNFANSRLEMYDRIDCWVRDQAARHGKAPRWI
jgi:pimeloyl-ACP methyl ester carboxylesterase